MEKRTLGAFIAILRKAKGLTQKQLAEMLNVSDKAVSRWERDECAPDLSAIPVLADIFGITADELLRGQRKQAEEPATHYETQKSEKQLRYLLKQKRTDFGIATCAAIGLALLGLVAAMIGNFGLLRAYLGFFVGCIFYVAAILTQAVNLIRGLQHLDTEELETETAGNRRAMILLSELSISVTVCLFAASLPLFLKVHDTYAGMNAGSWAAYGLLWGSISAILCAIVCTLINRRLGYRILPGLRTPKNKFRVRSALILAATLFVTASAHGFLSQYLNANLNWLGTSTKWETWEELKEYLETPVREDGEELELVSTHNTGYVDIGTYIAPDGNYMDITDHNHVLVYEEDMITPVYECVLRNLSVKRFYYSLTDDRLPIYTMDNSQLIQSENRLTYVNLAISSVYLIEIVIGIILYRRKVKKQA